MKVMSNSTPAHTTAARREAGQRLIESDRFGFEFVSELAEMESWRKEVYRPIYHIHKWWAKRLGSVFRSILLGSVLPEDADLAEAFYQPHSFDSLKVFDPFMGSGTTVGEAHKLGFTALGRDINPVAREAVRVALGPLNRDALLQAFATLSASVGERIRRLYQAKDGNGHLCDTLYFFWVKTLGCPRCSARVDLFPSYIFARHAYPGRRPEVRVYCPNCASLFNADVSQERAACPNCRHEFDLHHGPACGASATCPTCRAEFPIAKTVQAQGQPPFHRMFGKLVLTSSDDKLYLPILPDDERAYQACVDELARSHLALPNLALRGGYNTRQVLNYAYGNWRQFFNDRQLLALGWLHQAILDLANEPVRDAMLTIFSGCLEFNNMFASYKGEGTGAIRHMFAHHILKPERMPIEGNVWGTSRSSGAFSTLFKSRLLRAIEYRSAPFEIAVERRNGRGKGRKVHGCNPPFSGRVLTAWPPRGTMEPRAICLSCGSSATTGLPDASVDLVVTDPPFFDNVHYSELADFFYAWQQLRGAPFNRNRATSRHAEEVQDTSAERFAAKLQAVFSECHRVLREDGLLVFTYHHSRSEGWTSLAEAVVDAGFAFVNCHPVKAEMSIAAPKSQAKEPIQLDTIMVCRKLSRDGRPKPDKDKAFSTALHRAEAKIARLHQCRLKLSVNDRRVVLMGQFLVEACPQRSSSQLIEILESTLTDLDLAAIGLPETNEQLASRRSLGPKQVQPQEQMVLLDHPASEKRR